MPLKYSLGIKPELKNFKSAYNADVTGADATQAASGLAVINAILKKYGMMATA